MKENGNLIMKSYETLFGIQKMQNSMIIAYPKKENQKFIIIAPTNKDFIIRKPVNDYLSILIRNKNKIKIKIEFCKRYEILDPLIVKTPKDKKKDK